MAEGFSSDILGGAQIGLGILNARNARMDQDLRMQELKSTSALRKQQEILAAKQIEILLQKHAKEVNYAAQMSTAVAASQVAMSPLLPVMGPQGPIGAVPNTGRMNQTQAAMKFIIPVIAANEPEKVQDALNDIALNEARMAANERLGTARPRTPEQIEADKALTQQRESSTKVNEARVREIDERIKGLKTGKVGVDPEWVRGIKFMEERRGNPFSEDELQDLWNIHAGVKAKAAVVKPPITKPDYIRTQLPPAERADKQELKKTYKSRDQLRDELGKEWDELYGGSGQAQPESKVNEVIRITEGGRRAVFDATTKKFLRYAD